ncbi:MAG: hypothetical protein ACHQ2F_03245 [Desulfobaccales bacterium]
MEKKNPYLMVKVHDDKSWNFEGGGNNSDFLAMLAFSVYHIAKKLNMPWEHVLKYLEENGLPNIEAMKKGEKSREN